MFKLTSIALASAVVFVTAVSPPSARAAEPTPDFSSLIRFNVEKFKMPNGLTVLLHEDHSAPIISYQTWFRVGSKNEEPGFTGIAHLFEHMMFKGARRYSGEQFDTILQSNGAVNNAFTTQDYTGYYENLPSSKLELVMDIESDRMDGLQVTAENLKSEREVVKEERRFRVDNNPLGVLREVLFGTAFKVHPYKWPVIGYMVDIDNITLEKAVEFYHTYYAPNNAVVVIAGDFDSAEAKRLLNKYYSGIKSQTIPDKPRAAEPMQTSLRGVNVEKDVQSNQFAITYHTPKAGSDESYALDLVANIMGSGASSRLYQRLVYKDQTVANATAYNLTLQEEGLFQVFVTMKPGVAPKKAIEAVKAEMWRPRNLAVSDAELTKSKNQVMKGYVDSLKTVHGRAEALALNETLFGDYERLFKDLTMYQAVTKQQIQKAAAKYLTPDKSTIATLRPKNAPSKKKGGRK
jgi:zinc protease